MRNGNKSTSPLKVVSPLHKAMRQMSLHLGAVVRAQGIQGTEGHLLSYVAVYGPASVGELRRVFGHKPSTLTSLLDRLENAGWIERAINPNDRRGFLISTTRDGARVGKRARRVVEKFEAEILAQVSQRDLAGFHKVLETLADLTQVELRKEKKHGKHGSNAI